MGANNSSSIPTLWKKPAEEVTSALTNASNSSFQPHLEIFTPDPATHDEERAFSLFLQLPRELRLKIWQHSLRRQRIIKVLLQDVSWQTVIQATEHSGTNDHYCAVIGGYEVLSKPLRVNIEAREAALGFYRVHVPCRFTGEAEGEVKTSPGILHFNPEYTVLQIHPQLPVKDTLVDFLYRLKTVYDPRRVGLLNPAVDLNGLNGNDLYLLKSEDLDPEVREAFEATLKQLHEVWFVSTHSNGRTIVGRYSGVPTNEVIFNRSFPIRTSTPAFERLRRDPRAIAEDLSKLYVGGTDPRRMLHLWAQLLKRCNVSETKTIYKFCLSFTPPGRPYQIYNRESATRWLQQEDDTWRGADQDRVAIDENSFAYGFQREGIRFEVGAKSEKYKNEDLEKAVKPAFGFWLFPMEVLGQYPEEGVPEAEGFRCRGTQLLDSTEHWPELALSSLA